MKYIINSEKKCVTQKATMEKPVGYDLFDLTASVMATDRYNQCEIYKQHLASLRSFPAEWVRPEQDGKEVVEGVDFELKEQVQSIGDRRWYPYPNKIRYFNIADRRIVAVAIPAEKEGGGIVEALKPQRDMIPASALKNLQRLSELTGHSIDAVIAGWWIRFDEVQTLNIELDWRNTMIKTQQDEIGRLLALVKLQKEYNLFLGDESSKYVQFAGIHGMKVPGEIFKKGQDFRDRIAQLEIIIQLADTKPSPTAEPVEEKEDECKHEFETVISCKHCGKKVADNEDVKKYY